MPLIVPLPPLLPLVLCSRTWSPALRWCAGSGRPFGSPTVTQALPYSPVDSPVTIRGTRLMPRSMHSCTQQQQQQHRQQRQQQLSDMSSSSSSNEVLNSGSLSLSVGEEGKGWQDRSAGRGYTSKSAVLEKSLSHGHLRVRLGACPVRKRCRTKRKHPKHCIEKNCSTATLLASIISARQQSPEPRAERWCRRPEIFPRLFQASGALAVSEPIRLWTWAFSEGFSRPSCHPSRPAPYLEQTASWAVAVALTRDNY